MSFADSVNGIRVILRTVVDTLSIADAVTRTGTFLRTTRETLERAKPEHVESELRAQIERALAAGIDVTHLAISPSR